MNLGGMAGKNARQIFVNNKKMGSKLVGSSSSSVANSLRQTVDAEPRPYGRYCSTNTFYKKLKDVSCEYDRLNG